MTMERIPLVIAGPTASGKSQLALDLAKRHNGEIICADSRQFYAGMCIGTACPTDGERASIAHHGYGMLDPLLEKMDAGTFVIFALEAIRDVIKRKKRPILVGGTGLYLRSLYYGLGDVPKTNRALADELQARLAREGVAALYQELVAVDPKSAAVIESNDGYRITRALEIFLHTGEKASSLRQSFRGMAPQIKAHWLYKKPDRTELSDKIARRVSHMFEQGLVLEAEKLRARLPHGHWALTVMGYHEALLCADGLMSLEEAKLRTVIRHRQYAKRQFTWFNKEPFYKYIIK